MDCFATTAGCGTGATIPIFGHYGSGATHPLPFLDRAEHGLKSLFGRVGVELVLSSFLLRVMVAQSRGELVCYGVVSRNTITTEGADFRIVGRGALRATSHRASRFRMGRFGQCPLSSIADVESVIGEARGGGFSDSFW